MILIIFPMFYTHLIFKLIERLSSGQSFGEPPIFIPATAIAAEPSVIIRLSIATFTRLLKNNFNVHWNLTRLLSQRIRSKSVALRDIMTHNPYERIISLLNNYKDDKIKSGANAAQKIKIDYTRKQIAPMCRLRVETVIRVMRSLYDKEVLTIEKGKVFY